MSKKHDESKDLRLLSSVCRIDSFNKTITASKTAIIGNNRWGRIDYLTHYCGWTFIWDNNVHIFAKNNDNSSKERKRELKKANKEHKLTDKRKGKSNGKGIRS